jgi:hypothetical protein
MLNDDASRVVLGVLGAVLLFAFGFFVGRHTVEEPVDPALGLAQQAGLALPTEQAAAFFDGVVTTEEVHQAADRFESCAVEAGAQGFGIEISDFGWEVRVDELTPAVSECETRYFRTTAIVWSVQREPNGEVDPSVTTSIP